MRIALDSLDSSQGSSEATYPDAIAIRAGERFVVVPVADIAWFQADGSYSKIHVTGQRTRVLCRTLRSLERTVLDPRVFVRVHRSAIVNRRKIAAAEPRENGQLTLILHDGSRVQCSRRSRSALQAQLFFTT